MTLLRHFSLLCMGLGAFLPALESVATAQLLTAPEFLSQQDDWGRWAKEERQLQLTFRYAGRVGQQIKGERLPFSFVPERRFTFPAGISPSQRLQVTGTLRESGRDFVFEVSRILLRRTDSDALLRAADETDPDMPRQLLILAERYRKVAEFYDDEELHADVKSVRLRALRDLRNQLKQRPQELLKLADEVADLTSDSRLAAAIRFEAVLKAAEHSDSSPDTTATMIRDHLPGWDTIYLGIEESLKEAVRKDSLSLYETADDPVRSRIHRLLYRIHRAEMLRTQLADDGSNGAELAKQLRIELPEEEDTAAFLEDQFVDFRLGRVTGLNRTELLELEQLLRSHSREQETAGAVDTWLKSQESQFAGRGLEGILRLVDEYEFAFSRWKRPEHAVRRIELLKQAWNAASMQAPDEADAIRLKLEELGWTRIHDRWMTHAEMKALPRSDIELAAREGRVVEGMTAAQVRAILGEPDRVTRFFSSVRLSEIWVFRLGGSTRLTVLTERRHGRPTDEAVVTRVADLRN